MSVATTGRGGPYAEPAPALQQPIRSSLYVFILFVYSLYTHTHKHMRTTSNNSIVLYYYNNSLKYVFVIFIFFIFFHRSVRPSVYIRDENLDRNTNIRTLRAI